VVRIEAGVKLLRTLKTTDEGPGTEELGERQLCNAKTLTRRALRTPLDVLTASSFKTVSGRFEERKTGKMLTIMAANMEVPKVAITTGPSMLMSRETGILSQE
jgi:hypothetical protein